MKPTIAAAVGLIWCAGLASQSQPARAPVFRATAEGVRIDVSVRNRNRPVTGLTAADFELLDSGVPQEVVGVVYEQTPIDVTVGLDVSYSVDGVLLEQLRESVRDLRADLRSQDRLKLVSFNMRVLRQIDFGNDRRAVESRMAALAASGSTSLFDAIAVTLVASTAPERRHLVMMFTDGHDTNSITPSSTLLDVARQTNAALGFVFGGGSYRLRPEPPTMLVKLAAETGGQVVTVALRESLSSTFKRLLDEFRSSYVLLYRPSGVERGGFHPVQVRVKRPGNHEVRARRGYAGGPPAP